MNAAFDLSHRAFDLGVTRMTDHHDVAPLLAHLRNFDVDLGDERASGIEHDETAGIGIGAHRLGYAVRGKHDRGAGGNFVQLLDEHGAFRLEVVDDELVVDDFMAHVDRCAELRERLLDNGNRAVDAGAETTRIGQYDIHQS